MRSVELREQWEGDAGAAAGQTRLELAHLLAEDRGRVAAYRVLGPPNRARVATPGQYDASLGCHRRGRRDRLWGGSRNVAVLKKLL